VSRLSYSSPQSTLGIAREGLSATRISSRLRRLVTARRIKALPQSGLHSRWTLLLQPARLWRTVPSCTSASSSLVPRFTFSSSAPDSNQDRISTCRLCGTARSFPLSAHTLAISSRQLNPSLVCLRPHTPIRASARASTRLPHGRRHTTKAHTQTPCACPPPRPHHLHIICLQAPPHREHTIPRLSPTTRLNPRPPNRIQQRVLKQCAGSCRLLLVPD
jgi:hypothetical protein